MRLAILAIVVATSAYVLHAQRPHTHMAGGISEVNVQDAHVKEAAHKAVELLNEDGKLRGTLNGATGPVQLVSIEKVESQVVAGVKYYIQLKLKDVSTDEVFSANIQLLNQPWMKNSNDMKDGWRILSVGTDKSSA